MIHFATAILTLGAMLSHGLFGCCWHHSHACGVERAPSSQEEQVAHVCEHGHEHGHVHGEEADHDVDEPSHFKSSECKGDHHGPHSLLCEEDRCKFVPSGGVTLPDCSQSISLDAHPLPNVQLAADLVRQGFRQAPDTSPSGLALSLCAQPLTQVWLL